LSPAHRPSVLFGYAWPLVESSLSLNLTQGEMTSSITVPRCASAALRSDSSCLLSPENERPTNVAPSSIASAQVSIGGRSLTTPVLSVDPTSAVGENCP